VLIGDAAHALTLLSGQGASTAFWGASSLAQALLDPEFKDSPQEAFKHYQEELMPAVLAMQETTQNAKKLYIPNTTMSYYLRDAMMRFMPNAFFQKYFKRKYSRA
jgi:2-polyprenyl-6-methoxyphenol hydroxylase-like FAD-dependent oxidoreductase